jgi:hypothetical protein
VVQLNSELNLVFPIRFADDGTPLMYAYNTPISTEVFQANYRILAAVNAEIWKKGINNAAAFATVANLMLLDVAKVDALQWGTEDMGKAFLAEIQRLSYILAPGANGFEMLPINVAIERKVIDQEDWNEAESAIIFFTSGWSMLPRAVRLPFAKRMTLHIGGSITPLPPLEWVKSLPRSTPDESSKAQASSQKSSTG